MSNNSISWVAAFLSTEGYSCKDLDQLMKDREDINATYNGQTALHKSIEHGDAECTEKLLKYNANPTIQDNDGNTPLHLAILNNLPQIVEKLLEKGAGSTIHVENKEGDTPYDLADGDFLNILDTYERKEKEREEEAKMTPEQKQQRNKNRANALAKEKVRQAQQAAAQRVANNANRIKELRKSIQNIMWKLDKMNPNEIQRKSLESELEYSRVILNSMEKEQSAVVKKGGKRKTRKSKKTSKKSKKTRKH